MAMLRAPYNNAMRLGQGVNSFTQTLCMLDAVKKKPHEHSDTSPKDDSRPGLGISQIVSYSSRFVDKVSDVMKDMNVSAALAIKTGGFEGSGSGKYVNTDKFKEADLNFFIQVKVTNQEHVASDYTEFQDYHVGGSVFTEVYGDTFISGWEEGGEFNALLSIKLKDKSAATQISGKLEASLGHGIIKGEAKGSLNESLSNADAETTVTVNWCGGGQLKGVDVPWDIQSMSQAATNFADLVAMTPQRKYAILTKYTMLPSFWKAATKFTPLDYENAGIYSSQLLETYSDYKAIWKDLQIMTEDFQSGFGNFELVKAHPSKEIVDRLENAHNDIEQSISSTSQKIQQIKEFTLLDAAGKELSKDGKTDETKPDPVEIKRLLGEYQALQDPKSVVPSIPTYEPYPATIIGLLDARHDCRLEMVKVVNEVDNVTRDPSVALDPQRKTTFIHAALFKELIPVKREVAFYEGDSIFLAPEQKALVQRYAHAGADWRMSTAWGRLGRPVLEKDLRHFNTLWSMEPGHAFAVTVYSDEHFVMSLDVFYTNGMVFSAGNAMWPWKFIETFEWDKDQQNPVQEVIIQGHSFEQRFRADSISISPARNTKAPGAPRHPTVQKSVFHAPAGQWNLAGFWGTRGGPEVQDEFTELGVIWGRIKTRPYEKLVLPPLFEDNSAPTVPPQLRNALAQQRELSHFFRLGPFAGDAAQDGKTMFGSQILDYRWRGRAWHTIYFKTDRGGTVICSISIDSYSGQDQGLMNVPDPSVATKENAFSTDSRTINEVEVHYSKRIKWVGYIECRKNDGSKIFSCGVKPAEIDAVKVISRRPPPSEGRQWWVSGFYGCANDGGIIGLGVVWAVYHK